MLPTSSCAEESASCRASRSPTSTVRVTTLRPTGLEARSSSTAASKSLEGRANITIVVMSSLLWRNRRTVSRPMPRDAPVTSAVLVIVFLLRAQEEARHAQISGRGDLEVHVRAVDEVHVVAGVGDQGRVLGVDLPVLLRLLVGGGEIGLRELLRQLDVAQTIALERAGDSLRLGVDGGHGERDRGHQRDVRVLGLDEGLEVA